MVLKRLLALTVVFILVDYSLSRLLNEEKEAILKKHNSLRSKVVPSASNMYEMVWSDELARVAQTFALKCIIGRNLDSVNQQKTFTSVGENIAIVNETVDYVNLVQKWFDGRQSYNYDSHVCASYGSCYSYLQVVQAKSRSLGCGAATCRNNFTVFVCNYGPGLDYSKQPYKAGAPCSDCDPGDTCQDNQCAPSASSYASKNKASNLEFLSPGSGEEPITTDGNFDPVPPQQPPLLPIPKPPGPSIPGPPIPGPPIQGPPIPGAAKLPGPGGQPPLAHSKQPPGRPRPLLGRPNPPLGRQHLKLRPLATLGVKHSPESKSAPTRHTYKQTDSDTATLLHSSASIGKPTNAFKMPWMVPYAARPNWQLHRHPFKRAHFRPFKGPFFRPFKGPFKKPNIGPFIGPFLGALPSLLPFPGPDFLPFPGPNFLPFQDPDFLPFEGPFEEQTKKSDQSHSSNDWL